MKKVKHLVSSIKPPLLVLVIMLITIKAVSQNIQQFQNARLQSTRTVLNTCGLYPSSGNFVKAVSILNAGNKCNTTITAGAQTVYFTAKDKIILSPGFRALKGSNFIAYIKNDSLSNRIAEVAAITEESAIAGKKVNDGISVNPNPFSGSFVLSVYSKQNCKARVYIYNSLGTKIKEQPAVNFLKGVNTLTLYCPQFASGVYMLEVNFGDSKIVKKIVKRN